MDARRATTLGAAVIGAAAALLAAYLAYQVGQQQLKMQRSVLLTDFIVKTINFKTDDFRSAMNKLCATSAFPREDLNALFDAAGLKGETCPRKP